MTDRDAYYHRVQVTHAMSSALVQQMNQHSGETWIVQFSSNFYFRLIDMTDPRTRRDYGWYATWDEVIDKVKRLFPGLELSEALT